jgi:hypothetical protein
MSQAASCSWTAGGSPGCNSRVAKAGPVSWRPALTLMEDCPDRGVLQSRSGEAPGAG